MARVDNEFAELLRRLDGEFGDLASSSG